MNFSEVTTEVMDTIKRPDKLNLVYRKINAAISFFCLDNDFPRDFEEVLLPITATLYKQPLLLSALLRFRKFKYIKRAGTKNFLKLLDNTELFSSSDCTDRYYIAGDYFHINMASLATNLDVGYYKYPPLLTIAANNSNHWLLDVAPFIVIDHATAAVFRDIGDEKSANIHSQMAREGYLAARKDLGISSQ